MLPIFTHETRTFHVFGRLRAVSAARRVPDAALLAEMHKKRKKKKLRIRPDKVSGQKIVFGDDGDALDAMEVLARAIQVRLCRGVGRRATV